MTDYSVLRVIDGGLGMFADEQLPPPNPNPLWGSRLVREAPDVLKRIHLAFLEAGADVIETDSYQLSVAKVAEVYGIRQEEASDVITASGRVAAEAVREFETKTKGTDSRPSPLIAGSIGPYGASLGNLSEYNGRYADNLSVEELMAYHRPHLAALSSCCDFFALETVPCLKEAEALVRLLREFPNQKAWLSFTSLDGRTTCRGEPLEDAAAVAVRAEAVFGFGLNCGLPPRLVGPALERMGRKRGTKILIAYPNDGHCWSEERGTFVLDPLNSKSIAESVPEWLALGCRWIGGCCGSRPPEIAAVAAAVRAERDKR